MMAHILPEAPPIALPGEVLKTFRALKSLPDSFFIWHHLAPWQPNAPDFMMFDEARHVLLVKVSASSAAQAVSAAQLLLLEDDRPPLGAAETKVLGEFLQSLNLAPGTPLGTLIVFPNISHKQVLDSRLERKPGEPHWAGRELLQVDGNIQWEDFFPIQAMDEIWLEKVRHCFSPEVVVPAGMTVRPSNSRRIEAGLTNFLLDYDQESAVKMDLEIDAENQNLGSDFRLNIINGVAGSGKTLILLHRLQLLYHYYPEKSFLVLTHNKPLIQDMESKFNRLLSKSPFGIEWKTFYGWCSSNWPKNLAWVNPLSRKKRLEIIRAIHQSYLQGTSIQEHMLVSEIDWLKDQLPVSQTEYLVFDRRGRGFGLTIEQRKQMWNAISAYQQNLKELGKMDWGDVPQVLWNYYGEGKWELPKYDFILVDEAQFFAPIWMKLIQKALKPGNSHLFLVADPTQGFLGRKTTWKSLGLEARGRSHQLRRSYRTTRELMQFATYFYRSRLPNEKDDDILVPDILNMPTGAFPQIIPLSSSQDEISRIANEVAELLQQGCPRKDLLLLHANGTGATNLIRAINHRAGRNAAMDPKETYPGNYVRVTTINAGAGLESPIVFLVGLRELFEDEQSLRLSDEEREEIIRDNTRKVYMAVTRAGQRLVFTYVGDLPASLNQIPFMKT